MKILKTLLNVGSVIILMLMVNVKLRDHCYITGNTAALPIEIVISMLI